MTTQNKTIILAVISLLILIGIWTRKQWSFNIKAIYTLAYAVIGGIIYYKVLYNKPSDILGNPNISDGGFSY